jgi:hypothetical protein
MVLEAAAALLVVVVTVMFSFNDKCTALFGNDTNIAVSG